jgi:hypothetical protein
LRDVSVSIATLQLQGNLEALQWLRVVSVMAWDTAKAKPLSVLSLFAGIYSLFGLK